MKKSLFILFALFLPLLSFGQSEGSGAVFTYSSPEGNYVRVLGMGDDFESVLNKTDYFEVERTSIFAKETKKPEKVGRIEKAQSMAEVKRLVGDKDAEVFFESFDINSDATLNDFLQPNNSLEDYQLFNTYNIDFLRVTGNALLDENVERGEAYTYSVTRVDKNGLRDFWEKQGYEMKIGDLMNYDPYLGRITEPVNPNG